MLCIFQELLISFFLYYLVFIIVLWDEDSISSFYRGLKIKISHTIKVKDPDFEPRIVWFKLVFLTTTFHQQKESESFKP